MNRPIFVSYRIKDAAGPADLLYDKLTTEFPDQVFLDVQAIPGGAVWAQEIEDHVKACQILLVVIGPEWLMARNEKSGRRRLDEAKDWVRREIEMALARSPQPLIIPVLAGGAAMPDADDLPDSIQALAGFQGRIIRRDDRGASLAQLLDRVRETLRAADGAVPLLNVEKYLDKLRLQTQLVDIRRVQVGQRKAPRLEISRIYTPLTTMLQTLGKEREENQRVPLQQALQRYPRLVLVGDPGCGKSTFLQRIVFASATQDPNFLGTSPPPFPIFVETSGLSSFIEAGPKQRDPRSPDWLLHYMEWKSTEMDWGLPKDFFASKLKEGCLLLVDGLDEAPNRERRKSLAHLLERAAIAYQRSRIVVTSRPSAYGGETQIPGYQTVEIARLDREAVGTFANQWYAALYAEDPRKAAERSAHLQAAIGSSAEIQELAGNPLMLTALAFLHWNETTLPDQRIELYRSVLTSLARARDEKRDRASADQCLTLMQELAYTMHANPNGMQREITPYAAASSLVGLLRDAPQEERFAAAESFLKQEEIDSGILVGRDGKLRFWHRSFQEYLAAKALAGRDEDRNGLLFGEQSRLYVGEWRETVRLLGAHLCGMETRKIDGFLKQMLDQAEQGGLPQRARCVGLMGQILRDLRALKYQTEDPRYAKYLLEAVVLFEDAQAARSVEFQARLDVADALGQMGDPRLANKTRVRVDGGKFWMRAPQDDSDALEREKPSHQVEVSPFWIGKYPVTVSEYAEFLEKEPEKGMEPVDWQMQKQYPNRPVVSVDWHQASACCRSMGGRLPAEAQWESAARAGREGIRYPWGPQPPDEFKANYYEKGPGHVTPVGLYPEGATPNGMFDMAGNVWEWCEDWYAPYGQESDQSRKSLRGGAWSSDGGYLRVSDRDVDEPGVRDDSVGFRCVWE